MQFVAHRDVGVILVCVTLHGTVQGSRRRSQQRSRRHTSSRRSHTKVRVFRILLS